MTSHDTIFALSTPLARSAVSVIRLSGPAALPALQQLTGRKEFVPNTARLCAFRDGDGQLIDRGLALYFKAPASFTGEDCVELQLHGSMAVIAHMLGWLAQMDGGLRLAEAGEFTRRAYLNGKMDLVEAEGMADLIDADTTAQQQQALRQMQGSGSRYYQQLRQQIIEALAHLEAYIDFPDEEIPEAVLTGLQQQVDSITTLIDATLADNHKGQRLRDGFTVVIVGAPNVGKSSLINALSGKDAAIVSHTAGTTRDVIEVFMNLDGFPVTLVDTAGIRDGRDDIEEEGIRRARARARQADLKLVLAEAGHISAEARGLLGEDDILVLTKIDEQPPVSPLAEIANIVLPISAHTGEGLQAVLEAISSAIQTRYNAAQPAIITRLRHRQLLEQARGHLQAYSASLPLELGCEELRQAALAVGEITGKIATDELLDVIFSQFCIGK